MKQVDKDVEKRVAAMSDEELFSNFSFVCPECKLPETEFFSYRGMDKKAPVWRCNKCGRLFEPKDCGKYFEPEETAPVRGSKKKKQHTN
jgi:rubredoxin